MIGAKEGDPVPPSTIVLPAPRTERPPFSPPERIPDGAMGAAARAATTTSPTATDAFSVRLLTIGKPLATCQTERRPRWQAAAAVSHRKSPAAGGFRSS